MPQTSALTIDGKGHAEALHTQSLTAWALARGGFGVPASAGFADTGGADLVGGLIAGAFKGAPHIPRGDGAVGAPTLAEGEEFLGLGHVFLTVGDGPALLDAQVVDGENVGASEAEDQKHFDGPGADAANGDEAFDEFFVGHFFRLFMSGDDAFESFLGEILHGQDFCAGEAGFAQGVLAEFEHLFGRGRAVTAGERFNATEDGGGGFAGDGLVGDGFEKGFIGGRSASDVGLKGERFFDEPGKTLIGGGEVSCGGGEVKRQREGRAAHEQISQ